MKNEMSFINQLTRKLLVINKKDPILILYDNFSYEINSSLILEYLYYNIDRINTYLYNNDKIVIIHPLKDCDNKLLFQYYFYLDLLINYNINVKNFEFSIDIVKNIKDQQIDDSKKLRSIIISKIVKDLINRYKAFHDNYDDIKTINIDTNIKILDNSYDIFKKMNIDINNIKNIGLEEMYIKIINSLIENKKLKTMNL